MGSRDKATHLSTLNSTDPVNPEGSLDCLGLTRKGNSQGQDNAG